MLATLRWASRVSTAIRSRTWPVRSMNRSRMVNGPSRQVSGRELLEGRRGGGGAWPGCRGRRRRRWSGVAARSAASASVVGSSASSPVSTISRIDVDQVAPVEAGHPGDVEDLERVEPPRAGGHHPGQRDVVVGVGDGPERLLEVADLGQLEQRQPADHRVRDVLVAQPGDDRVAVLVLAVEDGDVRPARASVGRPRRGADRVDDDDRLVLGPGADDELDRVARLALGPQALVRLEAGLVARRSGGWRPGGRCRSSGSSARSGGGAAGRAAGRSGRGSAGGRSACRTR